MGRPRRNSPRVLVRGVVPHGHPLNSVLAGQKGAQALTSLLDLAMDGVRAGDIVPDHHPLSTVLAGKKGIHRLTALVELALEGLRARAHPLGGAGASAGARGGPPQTHGDVGASRMTVVIPKQLLNFRPRKAAD